MQRYIIEIVFFQYFDEHTIFDDELAKYFEE